jgi:hypothetical protein
MGKMPCVGEQQSLSLSSWYLFLPISGSLCCGGRCTDSSEQFGRQAKETREVRHHGAGDLLFVARKAALMST